ncbi:murein transglycosylase [Planosporangium mesophilum]|uniref:Murein transglycosylase n=1 Tax=Planosporangium mesophilum TaxID=689768 RepID=A0A8J3T7L1_9ACTN|nr:murein transglycosylase [Planosporangium mesophilum]
MVDPTTAPLRPAAPAEEAQAPTPIPAPDTVDKSDSIGVSNHRAPSTRRPGRWRALPARVGRRLITASRAGFRATAAWARRPYPGVLRSGLLVFALMAGSVLAGAFVVPALPTSTQRAFARIDPAALPDVPGAGLPGTDPSAAPGSGATGAMTRPSDLAAWARPLAAKLGVPVVAMQAYGYAELATAASQPTCQLRWTTLAGIGKIESAHGQHQATLAPDGKALPPIIGAPLDGQGSRMAIHDTDGGRLDGDRTWDHAVGPMQFIPSTWGQYGADADGDGVADINDIDDAALAAARYLCAGNRNLTVAGDWWAAIMAYNAVQAYIQDVFNAANDYGVRSR